MAPSVTLSDTAIFPGMRSSFSVLAPVNCTLSLMNKSRHAFVAVPKSYVSFTSGTMLLVNSPSSCILSVSASPIVILPPSVRLPVISVLPLSTPTLNVSLPLAPIIKLAPSKRKLLSPSSLPDVPAITISLSVRSETVAVSSVALPVSNVPVVVILPDVFATVKAPSTSIPPSRLDRPTTFIGPTISITTSLAPDPA